MLFSKSSQTCFKSSALFVADFGVDLKALSSAMTSDYQQALEALEAVQRHAFAVNCKSDQGYIQELASDEPPPSTGPELEELGSDEDGRSDLDSRRTLSTQASLQPSPSRVRETLLAAARKGPADAESPT